MEKATIATLASQGLSQRGIAASLGCSQATVKYWLKIFGIKTKLSTKDIRCCKYCGTEEGIFADRGKGRECRSVCKQCHYKNRIERYRAKKIKAVEYKGGKCVQCGYNKCPGSMHFHHKDPAQKDIHWKNMRSWSFEKTKIELDKCDLLCSNCHGEIHWRFTWETMKTKPC